MIVYEITDLTNGKIYVGQTIGTLEHRFAQHKHADSLIGKAIREHGAENFLPEVIEKCQTREELNAREKFWIIALNSLYPSGYNVVGGEYDIAQKILDVATVLFSEKDYAEVSVHEILKASNAGNIGAISCHFGGKRELYLAVLRELFRTCTAWRKKSARRAKLRSRRTEI